jgi:hypothetical protein
MFVRHRLSSRGLAERGIPRIHLLLLRLVARGIGHRLHRKVCRFSEVRISDLQVVVRQIELSLHLVQFPGEGPEPQPQ